MKIRFTRIFDIGTTRFRIGDTIDADERIALALVDGGYCERVEAGIESASTRADTKKAIKPQRKIKHRGQ